MKNAKNERKTIEIDRKRIPMKKLLHGKEIREAAKALEDFRLSLNEQEFLYGAKIYVTIGEFGETHAVARRFETDKEFEERLEKQRIAEILKKEREEKRRIQAEQRKKEAAIKERARAAEFIRNYARENKLTPSELQQILENVN